MQEQGTAGQMWIEVRIPRMYEEAKEDLGLGGWTDQGIFVLVVSLPELFFHCETMTFNKEAGKVIDRAVSS